PNALLISFNENVVERALTRSQTRAAARLQDPKQPAATRPYLGESFAAQVDGAFIQKAGLNLLPEFPCAVQALAWGNIPVLNEWKRLYPDQDALKLHEKFFGVRLVSPDGSGYVWSEQLHTMESISYGCPANPKAGPA